MPRTVPPVAPPQHVGELLENLGRVPPERIRMVPAPGTATKRDLLRVHDRGRPCELIDGTLVEKPMGFPEAYLEAELLRLLGNFVSDRDLGYLAGPDALIELLPDLVRGPDVCFVPWSKRPDGTVSLDPISDVIPELAVEVLSPKNTRREIRRKLKEYFLAGVLLAWVIDPRKRSADVYTGPDAKTSLDESGTLDGGAVLPGFRLPLATLFARLEKPAAPKPRKRKR